MKRLLKFYVGSKAVSVTCTLADAKIVLSFPYYPPMVNEVKNMQGREFDSVSKLWTIPATRRNLFAIDILTRGKASMHYTKPVPVESDGWPSGLWSHQIEMANFAYTRHRCILAAEPRTGKTWPTLSVISRVAKSAWWVGPNSVLYGIRTELAKRGLNSELTLDLMTYEDFRSRHITEDNCPQFIVFDECHKLKSPTSAQAKQALKASEIMDDIYGNDGYLIMLSGTPAPKDPTDWWMLTEICRPGFLLEGDVSKLRYRLGNMAQNESGYWTVRKDETHPSGWKESEVTNLYRRMRGIVKVWFKKDCLDLPPKKYEVREIKPTRAMILVANAITEQAESTLAARIKLRQLSDGFQYRYVYDPDGVRMKRDGYDFVGSPKEDELKRDLEQYEDIGRIVIYAGFQASIERICAVVKGCGWSYAKYDGTGKEVYLNPDDEISAKVDSEMFSQGEVDFSAVLKQMDKSLNTGSIKKLAFIGQTDSAGAGLEFSASPVNIYYSNSDSGAGRMQSEDRGHSGNMDKSLGLTIIDYCHLKVDYVIRDSLLNKRDLQNISMGELYDSL